MAAQDRRKAPVAKHPLPAALSPSARRTGFGKAIARGRAATARCCSTKWSPSPGYAWCAVALSPGRPCRRTRMPTGPSTMPLVSMLPTGHGPSWRSLCCGTRANARRTRFLASPDSCGNGPSMSCHGLSRTACRWICGLLLVRPPGGIAASVFPAGLPRTPSPRRIRALREGCDQGDGTCLDSSLGHGLPGTKSSSLRRVRDAAAEMP